MFHKTNFSYANLTNVQARKCFFMETNFKGSNMSDINLGVYPSLIFDD